MYVGVALLADQATQRLVARLRRDLRAHGAAVPHLPLPAHISLKQPFVCEDLAPVEAWSERLAASLPPVSIALHGLCYGEYAGQGIVGLQVVETPFLRALHNRINAELAAVVADPSAPFDGDAYRFHMTVAMGPLDADRLYRRYCEALADRRLDHAMVARRLGLAVCHVVQPTPQDWRLHRQLPLANPSQR
ncbi:MAG: 2'-5' RNA ligase family protein [Anaerolineae bacterium]|jgi:2'-5' RNA ligase